MKDAYRTYVENRFQMPDTWSKFTISVGAGRKIDIYQEGNTVVLLRSRYGRNSWDTADAWMNDQGKLERPTRGPKKVYHALCALVDRINTQGLSVALRDFKEQGICCCCGAALTDPVSKLRGIGPECIKKLEAQHLMRLLLETP